MKNKELRAWLILAAVQLIWIIPIATKEPAREVVYQKPAEIMETQEEIVRWKVEADTEEIVVEVEPVEAKATPTKAPQLVSLGTFRLTAYCNCSRCCGQWSGGPTASGKMPTSGRTIAVDKSVIPLGTKVMINGHMYIAEDTGAGIDGNCIDIYFDSHEKALEFGVKYMEVFIYASK